MPFTSESAKEAGKRSSRKGIPNNAIPEMKSFYQSLLIGQQDRIKQELSELEGKDFITAILKLSEYVVPKMRDIKQEIDLSRLNDDEIDALFKKAVENFSDEN